ncbi:hypothetical protein ABZZ17_35915 [Streptomyces sp. NPDC006512]|uniref:hypothetical protein n=1 Tax=Streptomyces sp. NPDC006512 TaxID=3154307 RepID=UPI0033B25484
MHDPFVQRFPWFVDHWSDNPGFTCVIAYDQGEPAGYAYGATQREGAEWWQGHEATPQPASATRTYALSELMVRAQRIVVLHPGRHPAALPRQPALRGHGLHAPELRPGPAPTPVMQALVPIELELAP